MLSSSAPCVISIGTSEAASCCYQVAMNVLLYAMTH